MEFSIAPLDGATAAEADLRAWYDLFVAARAEDFPDFPAMPFASFAATRRGARFLDLGPFRCWAARAQTGSGEQDGTGTLLGVGMLVYLEDDHGDWAVPLVEVAAAHRRRGVGTALLRAIADAAHAEGRVRLVQEQVRVGTAGEKWARAVGFSETVRNCWQMLHVQQTDPERWRVPTPAGFRLEGWAGAAPESLVAEFAAARDAIADAPHGRSAYRAPVWTVERIRRAESDALAAGDDMRYVVAVHEASGEIAALTGLLLMPPRIDLCWQRDTAVVRDYRGRGLGRVVKAAMMRALVAEHPGLGRIVTSTAADNAAMIRVNEQIGYVRHAEIAMFEADVAHMAAVLSGGGSAAAVPGPRRDHGKAGEPEPLGA